MPAYQPAQSYPTNRGKMINRNIYTFSSLTLKIRLDLHENAEKNLITATFEFPGFSKDEIQLDFQDGRLTVSAESKKSEDNADTGYTLRERIRGKFSRTLQLPRGVRVCRSS